MTAVADRARSTLDVARRNPLRVLVVDDEVADRLLMRRYLESCKPPFAVEEASEPLAALQRIRQTPFDCVLLDLRLPRMSGVDVLRQLAASRPSRPLAIIMMSGRGDVRAAVESLREGALDYLVKDEASPAVLDRAIRHAIEKVDLAHALEQQRQALELAHAELETKVAQRTSALTATNERLQREAAQRVQSEAALRRSEARYQDLYDHSPDMLVSVEPATAKVVSCNQTAADALGLDKNRLIGRSVFELYDPECVPRARRSLQAFLDSGDVNDIDLRLRREDGELIDISLNATALRADRGSIEYVRLSWRDVTERKKLADSARRHHEELAHVARLSTLGEMASGLAHELNQPLTAITNLCDLAVDLAAERPGAEPLTPILVKTSDQARRAGQIIRRLRALVQKKSEHVAQACINATIGEALDFMIAEARERRVNLEMDLDPTLPRLRIDRIQIQQVLLNLVRNAIDAVDAGATAGGRVRVRSARDATGAVLVSVRDNGPGIDVDLLSRVFLPFETTKSDGLGLGLSISRSIVEAHGGRLWVESNVADGATFSFALPVTRDDD